MASVFQAKTSHTVFQTGILIFNMQTIDSNEKRHL